jgi:hypothetical protein
MTEKDFKHNVWTQMFFGEWTQIVEQHLAVTLKFFQPHIAQKRLAWNQHRTARVHTTWSELLDSSCHRTVAQILRELIKRRCNLPANEGYCIGITILNVLPRVSQKEIKRKSKSKFFIRLRCRVLPEGTFYEPSVPFLCLQLSAHELKRAYDEYAALNSGMLHISFHYFLFLFSHFFFIFSFSSGPHDPNKILYKTKLMIGIPVEITVFLMMCDGYIFHHGWAQTTTATPYNGYLVNAIYAITILIYAITTLRLNCAFCFHMMCGILFGPRYYVSPIGSLNNPVHESQQLCKGGNCFTRRCTCQTFAIYIQGPMKVSFN